MRSTVVISLAGLCPILACKSVEGGVLFSDQMDRASFNASSNGWYIQSYAKGQGSYGLTPTAADSDTAFQYAVNVNSSGSVSETNTATTDTFAPPTAGKYLSFSASVQIGSASAATPGLVFGISAFGEDASSNEYATNFEFVTKQLNGGTNNGVSNDNLSLTSYNDWNSGTPANEWSSEVQSGIDSTDGFHTYTMRIYTNQVQYLVDNTLIAMTTTDVPQGVNLSFVLVAWAPDSSFVSGYAPLANNSTYYMDVDSAQVSLVTVPEPGSLTMMSVLLVPLSDHIRRKSRRKTAFIGTSVKY